MSSQSQSSLVLIDWGSSSFRLWVMDHEGNLSHTKYSEKGMKTLVSNDYEPLLETTLEELKIHKNVPVLICGMAGAAQGWQEANYIELPTNLNSLWKQAVKVNTIKRDVRILPGLSQRCVENPDVMRGEETLLSGALASGLEHETYCLPGTHSKWVECKKGKISSFKTFMTGELFAIMSEHSTLSALLNHEHPKNDCDDEFRQAIVEACANPIDLTNKLFSIRSGALLFGDDKKNRSAARLSGLLIGAEFAAMRHRINQTVGLIAEGKLANSYSIAMETLDIDFKIYDSHDLARTGLLNCARQIWSETN